MRTTHALAVSLLALVWTAKVGLAAQEGKDYAKEMRDAQSLQSRKQYRDSIQACEKMLGTYKEPSQVKEVTWVKIESLVLDSQHDAALKALSGLASAYADDKELQAAAALRTGDVQRLQKKLDDALATYRKLGESGAKEQAEQAADALLRAGDVLCTDLKKPDEGIAQYLAAEAKFGAQQPKRAADALRRAAVAHETQTKDMAKAAAAYQSLTEKYATLYDEGALAGLYAKAMECFLGAKKTAEAIAVAKKAEASLEAVPQKAGFALRRADALMEMKKLPEARADYQRLICSYPLEQGACQSAQARIVEAFRAENNWPDALGAARILYDAAADEQSIRNAAQAVAQAFLAVDGDLVRANEFLAYQRFGPDGPDGKPKTDDDIATNHLAKVKYPTPSAPANEQFQAAINAQPQNCDGLRAKGFLYIYWGKPKEGAAQFRLAFKAAGLTQSPAAAQDLVMIGMKAYTASFRGLDRVFEYLNYGPKGKSGKESIPDPFAGL